MKISYRTHPILEKLESGLLGHMGVVPEDEQAYKKIMPMLDTAWKMSVSEFRKNIQYITAPFAEAISLSIKKTLGTDLVNDLYAGESAGTILKGAESICYWILPKTDGGVVQVYFNFVETVESPLLLRAFIYLNVDKERKGTAAVFFSKAQDDLLDQSEKKLLKFYNSALCAILNFIKYAEIEIKYLAPKSTVSDFTCKYVNDSGSTLRVMDSKWFTTLIKSDAFKVRGHFRLQPKKKEGQWTKELIWINEFQKEGYTAPARKLSQLI